MVREVFEETGSNISVYRQLGICSFRYPFKMEGFERNRHIAVFYVGSLLDENVKEKVTDFKGQDSSGAQYVNLDSLNETNSSPLVIKAKEYLETKKFIPTDVEFNEWLTK